MVITIGNTFLRENNPYMGRDLFLKNFFFKTNIKVDSSLLSFCVSCLLFFRSFGFGE